MGAILLPFIWIGELFTVIAAIGVLGILAWLIGEGYYLGAGLFAAVIGALVFCAYQGWS